jgi:hypothetical protein
MYFSLFIEAALSEELSDEYYQFRRISDCYIYGPSTRNIRIEGLWRQQRVTTTVTWPVVLMIGPWARAHGLGQAGFSPGPAL